MINRLKNMKNIYKTIITILFLFITNSMSAQTFECFISNDRLVSPTQFEMDINVISTSVDFNLRTIQNCVIFNPAFIPAGSTIVASYVAGSSQLVSYSVGSIVWSSTGFGFQAGSNTGVTCATGTIITPSLPVRIGTYRLVSNVPFNCAPSTPTMVLIGDPAPVGLSLRMSLTKWNSTDCSDMTNSTITINGTFSRFPNSAYGQVNNMLPVITSQPVAALNCSGIGFATFSVTASSAPGVSTSIVYQWLENGVPISNGTTPNGVYSGATSSALTITNPGALLNGNFYSCAVTQCNADTSLAVSLSVSNSDDNNVCTIDACDPVTGALTHTPVNIDDANACTTDGCNPVSGVFHTAVNTNDNNACTTDGCNITSGVFHTPVNTNDNNICTTDACDTVSGNISHSSVNTNDNNACTTDGCDPISGVFHTPVNISDNNPCTNDACDIVSGNITHVVINTNDNNACTTDGCDPVTGVFHTPVAITDNDPCTLDACDSLSGNISHANITPQAPVVSVLNNCGYSILTANATTGSYIWSTTETTATINVTSPGTYTVSSIVNGCTGLPGSGIAAPLVVSVISFGNDTVLAAGNNLTLNAGTGFTGYLWSTNATTASISVMTTGTYFVHATDSNGCISSDTIVVTFSTAVAEVQTDQLFQLYPNPVNDKVYILSSGNQPMDLVRVYDVLSREIFPPFDISQREIAIEINTSRMNSGVYFVEIISGNIKSVKRFVKQ